MKRSLLLATLLVGDIALGQMQSKTIVYDPNHLLPLKRGYLRAVATPTDGYSYLNSLRQRASMITFSVDSLLEQAAGNHANYMALNQISGHYEEEGKPGFTGVDPEARLRYVGFAVPKVVGENVSAGQTDIYASIDGLFSAIYHRLGFLSLTYDLVGLGSDVDSNGVKYYSYEMSNAALRDLCASGQDQVEAGEAYYVGLCLDENIKIGVSAYDKALRDVAVQNPSIVVWPDDGGTDIPPVFFEESPDPLPECSVTGYPVSVQFNPYVYTSTPVTMKNFSISDASGNILTNTKILTKDNDPNSKLDENEFVLFPLDRLKWGSRYSVEFVYEDSNGAPHSLVWSFDTRALPYPYYTMDKGVDNAEFPVVSGKMYALYVVPENCNDTLGQMSMSYSVGLNLDTGFIDANTIYVKLTGDLGDQAIFSFGNGKKATFIVSESDTAVIGGGGSESSSSSSSVSSSISSSSSSISESSSSSQSSSNSSVSSSVSSSESSSVSVSSSESSSSSVSSSSSSTSSSDSSSESSSVSSSSSSVSSSLSSSQSSSESSSVSSSESTSSSQTSSSSSVSSSESSSSSSVSSSASTSESSSSSVSSSESSSSSINSSISSSESSSANSSESSSNEASSTSSSSSSDSSTSTSESSSSSSSVSSSISSSSSSISESSSSSQSSSNSSVSSSVSSSESSSVSVSSSESSSSSVSSSSSSTSSSDSSSESSSVSSSSSSVSSSLSSSQSSSESSSVSSSESTSSSQTSSSSSVSSSESSSSSSVSSSASTSESSSSSVSSSESSSENSSSSSGGSSSSSSSFDNIVTDMIDGAAIVCISQDEQTCGVNTLKAAIGGFLDRNGNGVRDRYEALMPTMFATVGFRHINALTTLLTVGVRIDVINSVFGTDIESINSNNKDLEFIKANAIATVLLAKYEAKYHHPFSKKYLKRYVQALKRVAKRLNTKKSLKRVLSKRQRYIMKKIKQASNEEQVLKILNRYLVGRLWRNIVLTNFQKRVNWCERVNGEEYGAYCLRTDPVKELQKIFSDRISKPTLSYNPEFFGAL